MTETLSVSIDQTRTTEAVSQFELPVGFFHSWEHKRSAADESSVVYVVTVGDSVSGSAVTDSQSFGSVVISIEVEGDHPRRRLAELRRRAAERIRLLPPYEAERDQNQEHLIEMEAMERLQADPGSWLPED